LLRWLEEQSPKPDVICLSNILLAGLVRPLKSQFGVPVVSLLQDEDGFLDGLAAPYSQQAWELVGDRCVDIDGFIAVSKYYAEVIGKRLGVGENRIHVVPTGIEPQRYKCVRATSKPPTIGYLSRMCPDRGLDTLTASFIALKSRKGFEDAKLRISGGAAVSDRSFLNQIKRRLDRQGLLECAEFLPDFKWPERAEFLKSLSVMCVPEKYPVAGGVYVLEAWASSVPVVEPDMGAFSELVGETGGGMLYEPGNTEALTDSLAQLLVDPQRSAEMGERGRNAVCNKYNIEHTSEMMANILYRVVTKCR
jgi:glycosyltransferase involved in cell wall biosynthesis